MDLELLDHWILVAGASNGLGAATTAILLAEGANILAVSRRPMAAQESSAGRLLSLQADLSTSEGQASLRNALESTGPLRGVLATIGSGRGAPGNLVDRFALSSDRNLLPLLRTLEACEEFIIRDERSSVVLVSSIAGLEYMACPPEYAAAKASVSALSGHLARQWAPTRVNVLAPGNMMSKGSVWERKASEDPAGLRNYLETEVALRRVGSPEEVARVATFLLSPMSSFITGSTLVVDGGQSRAW